MRDMTEFDVKVLNKLSTINRTKIKLSNSQLSEFMNTGERIFQQKNASDQRSKDLIIDHTVGGFAAQKLVCDVLGPELCIPGPIKASDNWIDEIAPYGDCSLITMKNRKLEIKSMECQSIDKDPTMLHSTKEKYDQLLRISNRNSPHYAPYVLSLKREKINISEWLITSSILFMTSKIEKYFQCYQQNNSFNYHMKTALMHMRNKLIYFDPFSSNNNENGDYVSGIVNNNNDRYVMKRYQLQPEPIDLEKEYAA